MILINILKKYKINDEDKIKKNNIRKFFIYYINIDYLMLNY